MSKRKKPPTQYTEEFRAEVVALCRAGDQSYREVAENLGVPYQTVCTWVQKAAKDKSASSGLSVSEKEELNRLRKENARLRMERDILKKATAFFASENR